MYEFFDRFHPRIIDVRQEEVKDTQTYSFRSDCVSFVYVNGGDGTLYIDGTACRLSQGYAVHIPKRRCAAIKSRESKRAMLAFFVIEYEYKLVDWDGTPVTEERQPDAGFPFGDTALMPDPQKISGEMKRLARIWTEKRTGYTGKAMLSFLNLLQWANEQRHERQTDDSLERSILDCAAFIESHYQQSLERSILARKASLSDSYFSVLFKKYIGCSPVQYITRVRLGKAMELLRESNKPVSVVAMEVGYRDPLYFTRVFSREVGVTPRQYRGS